jgi:methylmalonyl-CoA/ethylmalonyl-CoA epimerase
LPGADDIAALIQNLSSDNLSIRERAAAELFERGCQLARAATGGWLADKELKDCFVLGHRGFPQITVGIAVDPDEFERVRTANGSPRLANVPPDQDAKEFELHSGGGVRLDILTTRAPDESGAIARYLQRRGAGIQQVEISVNDVDRATEILGPRFGIAPIYPATRAGADGTRVNFFLVPVQSEKVLIELVEESRRNFHPE